MASSPRAAPSSSSILRWGGVVLAPARSVSEYCPFGGQLGSWPGEDAGPAPCSGFDSRGAGKDAPSASGHAHSWCLLVSVGWAWGHPTPASLAPGKQCQGEAWAPSLLSDGPGNLLTW